MDSPQQPNNNKRTVRPTDTTEHGHHCHHCQHCKYAADKARDDLPVDVVAAIEKATLDMVEAAMLMQRIEQARLFRVDERRPLRAARFFDVFEQFSEN